MNNEINILSNQEIEEELKTLPGWVFENNKIKKEFEFNSFMELMGFINEMAKYYEKIDHHADMHIFFKKIIFELQRFDVGGKVTNRDIIVAREIERLFREDN